MRWLVVIGAAMTLVAGCGTVQSAPPEMTVAALDFTPTSGLARVYVYRPSRAFGSGARLKVALDGQVLGKVGSGTFMMVEVEPGPHRVSGLTSESDQGVEFQALADSSYFFKIWPRMGFISAQSGVEAMDAVEGRRAVQGARMVVATQPARSASPAP